MVKVSAFSLSLKFLFILLQLKQPDGTVCDEDTSFGEQMEIADKVILQVIIFYRNVSVLENFFKILISCS